MILYFVLRKMPEMPKMADQHLIQVGLVLVLTSMSFRDANVIVIETSRTVVKVGLGLPELLKPPLVVSHPVCC